MIPLYRLTGTTLDAIGALKVEGQGQALTVTPAALNVASSASLNLATMRFIEVNHPYSTGGLSVVNVGLSADGVLLLQVSPRLRAELDDRRIALIGLETAKLKFGVPHSAIKGVVIELAK